MVWESQQIIINSVGIAYSIPQEQQGATVPTRKLCRVQVGCFFYIKTSNGCGTLYLRLIFTGLAPEELCNGTNATSYEPSECTTSSCLSHWENWSSWSHCSSSCGSGYSFSTRECIERQNTCKTTF